MYRTSATKEKDRSLLHFFGFLRGRSSAKIGSVPLQSVGERSSVRRIDEFYSVRGLPPIETLDKSASSSAMHQRSRNNRSSRKSGEQNLSGKMFTLTNQGSTKVNGKNEVQRNKLGAQGKLCCDKCDGRHATEACPHFKKDRDPHPDGQKNFYKALGGDSSLPGQRILSARVIRQPGDGNCLFHSMSYGLGDCNATLLRREICDFIRQHPNFKICDTSLQDWIKWDSRSTCSEYARKMSRGSWGGGIEMAVCSRIRKVNIHVYQKSSLSYTRISAFDFPENAQKRPTLRILYQGGVHYDALSTHTHDKRRER